MAFAGLNYVAILAAAIAGFAVGALWYGLLFGKAWMAALGKSEDELGSPARAMAITFVAQIVMAWILAGVIGHLGEVTIRSGIISAAFIWLGFVMTTMVINHAFQRARPMLTLIDGGHFLAVLVVMGAVIGAIGV